MRLHKYTTLQPHFNYYSNQIALQILKIRYLFRIDWALIYLLIILNLFIYLVNFFSDCEKKVFLNFIFFHILCTRGHGISPIDNVSSNHIERALTIPNAE